MNGHRRGLCVAAVLLQEAAQQQDTEDLMLAAQATDDCGAYRSTTGLATGDYTARFDSTGPVTPASTGLSATLRREDP